MASKNSVKALKKVTSTNPDVQKLNQNVDLIATYITNVPQMDGVLVKAICLKAGVSNEIRHKLGRKPLGWTIVRKRQDSRIWDLQDTNPQQSKSLSIACSHDCQIDIWIF